jgi:hypothetical protein
VEIMSSNPVDSITFTQHSHYSPMGGCHVVASNWISYATCHYVIGPLGGTTFQLNCQLDMPCHCCMAMCHVSSLQW